MAPPAGPWHFGSMTDDLPLAAEFPPASREEWLKLVRAALKDRLFGELLRSVSANMASIGVGAVLLLGATSTATLTIPSLSSASLRWW